MMETFECIVTYAQIEETLGALVAKYFETKTFSFDFEQLPEGRVRITCILTPK